jgi:maleylpyruvate isomerase
VPVQDRPLRLGGEVLPRGVEVEAELLTERAHQPEEVVGDVRLAPRLDGALPQRRLRVGDHELRVDLEPGAEPVTHRAGTERGVEGERPRLELVGVDGVLVGARHLLAEAQLAARVLGVEVDEVEDHQPAGQQERGLHRIGEPPLRGLLDREPVDDDLDRVLLLLLELRPVGEHRVKAVGVAVDAHPREALRLQLPEQLDVLALAAADHRGQDLEAAPLLQRQDLVDDLLRRLPLDRRPTGRAVRPAGPGVEQAEVVVDLGDRADRRAGVLRGGLLVDRHRGREALDEVDVGLVHLAEELAGVRRERLDVAALALREDRVEGERRLARPGQSGEDDEGVPREVDRDVLEVVLPGAPDDELVGHYYPSKRSVVVCSSSSNTCSSNFTWWGQTQRDEPGRAPRLHHDLTGHRQCCVRQDGPMPDQPMPDQNLSVPPADLLPDAVRRLIRTSDALADEDYAAPSGLPDWTRAHVLAHLTLNAEGLAAALSGLVAGDPKPMYVSQEARDGDIAELAGRDPSEIRTRLLAASTDLSDAIAAVPEDEGDARIERVPGGPSFPASAVPGMRLREVEIHHADLAAGYDRRSWPPEFAAHLLDAMLAKGVSAGPFRAHATDLDRTWTFGDGGPTVSGTGADLGWWLSGRGGGEGLTSDSGVLPRIGAW